MKKISVIISVFSTERAHTVKLCIESMRRQTLPPFEIILVLDPKKGLFDFYRNLVPSEVRVITSEGCGMSNARNSAIHSARGEIVAFIDDDAYASDEWIANIARNYTDPRVIGVGGAIRPLWEGRNPQWFPEELYWVYGCSYKGLPEKRDVVRNPIGCNMSFRRSLFEKVGYFNTPIVIGKNANYHNLIGAEEAAFSLKALAGSPGSIIIYEPDAVVYHRVPRKRAALTYILSVSYHQGFSKALITRFSSKNQDILFTERNYMNTLLKESIPRRLKKLPNPKSASQLLVLFAGTAFVLFGYLTGKLSQLRYDV